MAGTTAKILFLSVVLVPERAYGTLVPPHLDDAVVALGSMQPVESPGQPCTLRWTTEGTGFLYGYLAKNDPDPPGGAYVPTLPVGMYATLAAPLRHSCLT
jgi:hypothetical protein